MREAQKNPVNPIKECCMQIEGPLFRLMTRDSSDYFEILDKFFFGFVEGDKWRGGHFPGEKFDWDSFEIL